jgi:hypothetical protein
MPAHHHLPDKLNINSLFHHIFTAFLVVLTVFSCFFSTAFAETKEKLCIVEAVDYPGKDPTMWDGLYAASDGTVYTALITEGGSAHMYRYFPDTGEHKMICDLAEFLGERGEGIRPSSKIHCQPVEDDEGNIYVVTLNNGSGPISIDFTSWRGGHWVRYDPKKDEFTDLGLVDEGDGPYPLAIDKKRMYLFGIGFKGYLYRLDMNKGITKNFGRVANTDVCRSIFCDDKGNVYGSFPTARVWKYDAEAERVVDLSVNMPYDPTIFPTRLHNPIIDRTHEWRKIQWDPVEKVAYGVTCGSGSILFKYDPDDGPEGKFTELGPLCDKKFFGRKDIPYSTLSLALDSKNRRIYYAPSARSYTLDEYIETFGSPAPHTLVMYDLKTNKRIELGEMKTKNGERVFGCEGASVTPDGTLYLCGQVECKDPKKATRHTRVTNVPISLRLIIYKPEFD